MKEQNGIRIFERGDTIPMPSDTLMNVVDGPSTIARQAPAGS